MGYTHRYTYTTTAPGFRAAWPRMAEDAQRVVDRVEAAGVELHDLVLEGEIEDEDDGGGTAEEVVPVSDERILINGSVSRELDCEPLVITRTTHGMPGFMHSGDGTVSTFCKTDRPPYDLAVCAILLRCHMLAPDTFHIDSDGDWDEEWAEPAGEPTAERLSPAASSPSCSAPLRRPAPSPYRNLTESPVTAVREK